MQTQQSNPNMHQAYKTQQSNVFANATNNVQNNAQNSSGNQNQSPLKLNATFAKLQLNGSTFRIK